LRFPFVIVGTVIECPPMMTHPRRFLPAVLALALIAVPAVQAAKTPVKPAFAYALGSQTSGPNIYSVSATAPRGSKLKSQTIRLAMKKADPGGRSWTFFYIVSGKSRSQAQTERLLFDALKKFPKASPGKELARIGGVKQPGGEVRIVAEDRNALLFAYNPPMVPANPRLTAADAAIFTEILRK
jgi:hypothetical protein